MRQFLAVAVIILVCIGVGFALGRRSAPAPRPVTVVHTADDVTSFNDGFLDGESNCQK